MESEPLKGGDHGAYADLAARALPEGLVIQFIPSLAALLTRAEQLKGAPLTESEVARVRDAAPAIVSRADAAEAVTESRGYADVDPANVWESWQAVRGG
jgi:hypothetical protein